MGRRAQRKPESLRAIGIIDTSVFCNILRVPNRCQDADEIHRQLRAIISEGLTELLLPTTSILETGNHIAQNGDGRLRRAHAESFVTQVISAFEGEAPWTPTVFPNREDILSWIHEFPECAMREVSFGDLTIIKLWEAQRELYQRRRRVYIWTCDEDLKGYDTHPS